MTNRNGWLAGGLVAAIFVTKLLVKGLAFGGAYYATKNAVDFFETPAIEKEMRAGFADVSPDWSSFLEAWSDSSATSFKTWGARIAAEYVTEDELIDLYHMRAVAFRQVAADPARNALCGGGSTSSDAPDFERLGLLPAMRITGRGFARHHVGRQPWSAPVDVASNEAVWEELGEYLTAHNQQPILDFLLASAEGNQPSAQATCENLASLYQMAADHPQDWLGPIRMIDFMRALDQLGAAAI